MTDDKRERIAKILVEATVTGDAATCAKYGISSRTLQRYRRRVATGSDVDLSRDVGAKKALVEKGWAEEIPGALKASVEFLRKAAEQADPKSPEAIHSVAGAMKLLSEASMAWKMLDARISRMARPVGAADGSLPAGAGAGGAAGGDGDSGSGDRRPPLN